jgi:hypothetical protein
MDIDCAGIFLARLQDMVMGILSMRTLLAGRATVQARDIFDIYLLRTHSSGEVPPLAKAILAAARKNVFAVEYELFRDTVIEYLAPEDRESYGSRNAFDDMRLLVDEFIGNLETGPVR